MKCLILFIFLLPINCLGQWSNLSSGFNYEGRNLFYDSTSSSLLVTGNFTIAGSISANHIAKWNGQIWSSLGNGAPFGAPGYSITKYQNEIYVSSIFYPSTRPNWLAKWTGLNWDTITPNINGPVYCFNENNNGLYIGGSFKTIGVDTTPLIAKYDGSNFTGFPLACDWGFVSSIEFYHNQMYIGGNFYDTLNNVNDLEYYDGHAFQSFIPGGLSFGSDNVGSMVTFNNELYIAGSFSNVNGVSCNNIMRWDGSNIHPLDSGLNGPIYRMRVYPDGLYVCGPFTAAGSLTVSGIAKWDGSQWLSVVPNFNGSGITDFLMLNNEIYITGLFNNIDSIQVNNIAKYNFTNSVNENSNNLTNLFPNPTNDFAHLQTQKPISTISITDLLGRKLFESKFDQTFNTEIDLRNFVGGLYFIYCDGHFPLKILKN